LANRLNSENIKIIHDTVINILSNSKNCMGAIDAFRKNGLIRFCIAKTTEKRKLFTKQ